MKVALGILLALALAFGVIGALNAYLYQEKQAPAEQYQDLSGSSWQWERTEFANGASFEGTDAFILTFDERSFTSTTDCNSVSGMYMQQGGVLHFSQFVSTKMFCAGALEEQYLRQLSLVYLFAVADDTLRLSMEGEQGTMTFVRIR